MSVTTCKSWAHEKITHFNILIMDQIDKLLIFIKIFKIDTIF